MKKIFVGSIILFLLIICVISFFQIGFNSEETKIIEDIQKNKIDNPSISKIDDKKIIYEYKETLEGVQEVEIDNSSFLEEQIDTSDTENEITLSSRKEKYLSLITIDENCEIYDFTMSRGEDFQYAIYEIRSPETNDEIIYWEVVVLDNENVVTIIRQKKDENVSLIASTKEIILELDVNFDGKNDILVNLGRFGPQGSRAYNCYLRKDDTFVNVPSFLDIPNPSIDSENQVVLSYWRNSATSHSNAMFYLIEDEFVEMERLTSEPTDIETEDGEYILSWKDEVFIDGQWKTREYFTEEDYDEDAIHEKIYGEKSHWGISQDRWYDHRNDEMLIDMRY